MSSTLDFGFQGERMGTFEEGIEIFRQPKQSNSVSFKEISLLVIFNDAAGFKGSKQAAPHVSALIIQVL
jgi:hypothetical protein